MNKFFKTIGIILRRVNLNEADQIVTVLTQDLGKIHLIAKGSRRLKSKFCGRLELFYHVEIHAFQGRNLNYINDVMLMETMRQKMNLQTHGILFYVAELTHKLIQDDQHVEEIYRLLVETLQQLRYAVNRKVILQTYIIKLLTELGFMAPWNRCVRSNEKLNADQPLFFCLPDASAISQAYASPEDIRLSSPVVKWVNYMQSRPFAEVICIKTTVSQQQQVQQILEEVLKQVLGRPLKSKRFLEQSEISKPLEERGNLL
jgi:DNA repair protein RecO (recombination protein O)